MRGAPSLLRGLRGKGAAVSSMSSPRVLFVSAYRPAWKVMPRVLGGARVSCREPGSSVGRRVGFEAVVMLMPPDATEQRCDEVREWARLLVGAGTSVVVLCERDERLWPQEWTKASTLASRSDDGSPQIVQMAKPVRGAELRSALTWLLGRAVTRDPSLGGHAEVMMTIALHTAERHQLSPREYSVVLAALEMRERELIAERLGIKKRSVDEYAARIAERAKISLDSLVRRAWVEWAYTIADHEGSGLYGISEVSGHVVGRGPLGG